MSVIFAVIALMFAAVSALLALVRLPKASVPLLAVAVIAALLASVCR